MNFIILLLIKTKEYIEEFYDYNDYGQPLYREYHKNPQTNSVIYYYDNSGNVIETKTYDEKGAIVDVQKVAINRL